jgi:ribose transport system substrate-binding protein
LFSATGSKEALIVFPDRSDELAALSEQVERDELDRRDFLARAGKLGLSAAAAAALLGPVGAASAARSAAPRGAARLVFDGAPKRDRNYKGTNAGGLVGAMPVGRFPARPVPWLAMKAKERYKIGYSIFNSAYPLPVAFAERGKLDGRLMGVDVLTYDNAGDPAKSLQNAELMIQQGVDFGIHLVLFPDVAERIAKLFDRRGIPQLFYAVAPAKTKKPYLVLPDFGTGMEIGRYLGQYAKANWGGKVDKVVLMGQKQTGAISEYRTGGGRAGIESVLGKLPDDKVVTLDGGGGLLEESQRAMADWLTANPEPRNILVVGFADTLAVGAVRALEAAGRDKTAAAGGQPGVPDGLNELRKGPGKSAFKVSFVQDLAFASWPVALGIYALEGGKLPDVLTFTAQQYTAQNIAKLPSQSNKGYRPRRP